MATLFKLRTEATAIENVSIATYPCPNCYMCGARGKYLYRGLTDRLFSAPGNWDLKQCPVAGCHLIWLDPMPLPDEVGKAYDTYYTHEQSGEFESNWIRRLSRSLKTAYIESYCGSVASIGLAARLKTLPIRLVRSIRDELELPRRYFRNSGGRMLDIGCGDGKLIEIAKTFGWDARGIDFDEKAVAHGISKGLNIKAATLPVIDYPQATFDLLTIAHVIEHLHDPLAALRESYRVLSRDGLLVILTPNTEGALHRKHRVNWYSLDPPRHLMLFAARTLKELVSRAGFSRITVTSTLRLDPFTKINSQRIASSGHTDTLLNDRELVNGRLSALFMQSRFRKNPLLGDELLLEARK